MPSDTTRERVAGATIIVSREQRDSVGNGPATVTSVLIGSISTDARGEFELTRVPAGAYFRLDVTPPSTSPYRAGTSGTVSFAPDTRVLAVVNLTSH
ncbi:MAG: hypothetical protein ABIY52_09995 [Gemmatimonadaceae bacterium]